MKSIGIHVTNGVLVLVLVMVVWCFDDVEGKGWEGWEGDEEVARLA